MVMRHAATIAFAAACAALVVVSTLLTQQAGSVRVAPEPQPEDPTLVIYEQEVQDADGNIVIVRTYAGEAATEDALWALHKARVARAKGGQ